MDAKQLNSAFQRARRFYGGPLVCAVALSCALVSCLAGESVASRIATSDVTGGGVHGAPSDGNTPSGSQGGSSGVTWIGRTHATSATNPNNVSFSWSGVAFGVHFMGTQLAATMFDIPATFQSHTGDSYYDVVVDGQPGTSFHLSSTSQSVPIATGLPAGEHTVWVTKRTEGMIGSAQFGGVDVGSGTLLAPPPHLNRRIEVLGASTDNGYGDLATNCSGYNDFQQSQDIAWPQLAANALKAELVNLAYSGKGLAVNLDPVNDPVTLPDMYSESDTNLSNATWDFSQWKADVVIIDLGGNDLNGDGGTLDTASFEAAYVKFIQQILQNYPNATIYAAINSTEPDAFRTQLETALNAVVSTCQSMGMTRVKFYEFTQYTGSVFGCDGHPSAQLHQSMAAELVTQLQQDMGWQ